MAVEYSPIDVVTELHQLQFAKYLNVTALAVFLFDYCLTLSLEVHHVWGRKWEITRIVFTISRYLPFIASPMVCFCSFRPLISELSDTNDHGITQTIYMATIAELITML
ncbi:hypothetical protein PAXINDRAFT_140657 [Paxillus involutus ATCC 200175]|uniref:DUF6533 domain-containing protein n=1 Tax=Paxillus involutus ATCC 200175 TaxID=664439 RepID=A0A0C9SML6_PAXIN|nr:hypothetical protein PAXINDRAFT_140657 [Paxillus involutus ATCC 200175]